MGGREDRAGCERMRHRAGYGRIKQQVWKWENDSGELVMARWEDRVGYGRMR
jgi:hypothetical protein